MKGTSKINNKKDVSMKFMYKQLLTVAALLSINNAVNASYEFDFSNLVSDGGAIVLRINQRRADNKDYYQIIPHGSTPKQVFDNAFCLEKISWAPYNPNAPLRGGLDLVDRTLLRIPEENQRKFGDVVAPRYAFTPIEIKMLPNKVFSQTVADATNLLKGIDTLTCQVLSTVKDFEGISAAENLTKGATDMGSSVLGALENASGTKSKFDELFKTSTSASNDPFANLGGGSTTKTAKAKETNKCQWGLGQIGDAAGKLAGSTLCKSRQFIIVTKLDKEGYPVMDMRFGRPKLQALTGMGE
jgi:hypothetical protein